MSRISMWLWPRGTRKRILHWVVALGLLTSGTAIADVYLRNLFPFLDFTGLSATNSTTGSIDRRSLIRSTISRPFRPT